MEYPMDDKVEEAEYQKGRSKRKKKNGVIGIILNFIHIFKNS